MGDRHWTTTRFAIYLAAILAIWLGPVAWGAKVLLPVDLLWQDPAIQAPEGFDHAHNTLIGDMLYENYVWKSLYRQALRQGEWPLWNPYSFAGHPLYTTGQASTFYPPNLLFALIPIAYAYGLYTFLHLWAGGMFQYLFLRRIGVGGFGASIGGVTFALCGFFVFRIIWPMLLGSAIWLPLMLLLLIRLAEATTFRQTLSRMATAAVIFAMPLLSGFFEIAFYAFMVAGVFTLACVWRLIRIERAPGRAIGLCVSALAAVGIALMLSGPQLLPFLEVKDLNVRSEQADYQAIIDRALVPYHLLPMVVPDIFGNPARHQRWDLQEREFVAIEAMHGAPYYAYGTKNYSENGYYLGLLPLLLLPLSIRGPGRHRLFFWMLLIGSLLLAFGTPIYRLFYTVVPGFEQVRTPFRWMFPATFAIACLAAGGARRWYARLNAPVTARAWILRITLWLIPLVGVVLLITLHLRPEMAHQLAEQAIACWPRLSMRGVFGFQNAWDLAGTMTGQLFRLIVVLGLSILALNLRVRTPRGVTMASFVVLAVLAFDLVQVSHNFNTKSDPQWLDRTSPAIEFLQRDSDPYRIARFGSEMTFQPNLPALYGIHDAGGYDSIVLSDYADYLEAISPQRRLYYNQIDGVRRLSDLDSPLLDMLNVRYLLAVREFDHPDWPLAYEDETIRIYRNQREHSRVYLAREVTTVSSFGEALLILNNIRKDRTHLAVVQGGLRIPDLEPGAAPELLGDSEVKIVFESLNRVIISADSDRRGVLVLADMIYPGWQVYVDGVKSDLLTVNAVFRGVEIGEGMHVVEFRFEPQPLRRGWWLAAAGGLIVIACWLVGFRSQPWATPSADRGAGHPERSERHPERSEGSQSHAW